ncbi:MAG TPA: hypothetical protein VMT03_24495 [Polyangia bacterium]|nr:hypothetical protein [Polyangia bacterium]
MAFARRFLWVVPIALFFLNPGFACSSETEYQFGAAEMRAAVEGEWTFAITPASGTPVRVQVRVSQAGPAAATTASARSIDLVRPAHACGSRTLLAGASACADATDMPLDVSFVDGDALFSGAGLSGKFTVYGLAFTQGSLELTLGPYQFLAVVNADGSLLNPQLGPMGDPGTLSVMPP